MDLLDDNSTGNAHEYTVSEISGAVKRVIEGEFGRVRVRGEVGRVSRPSSGHMYFDLKDQNAVIAAISWRGQVDKMPVRPEEGMEVIATGRMTTFPGQSRYQLIVDSIEPAGAGALMAMLEARKKALSAEGLFDPARKCPLPWLPEVIGVITSPSGAVIRDILHRLRDRFPRRVLIWPVAVQGQACAPEVSRAINGFNAMPAGGPLPRPDLIIVARGGGSIEDLWGFNEEIVVRAAAASRIPLISAVGHETDTTLIDYASDRRAPTPTAAAEMAVPVRAELSARLGEAHARMARAAHGRVETQGQRLRDLSRGLGRPEALIQPARQRFDLVSDRLRPALRMVTVRGRERLGQASGGLSLRVLQGLLVRRTDRLNDLEARLHRAMERRRADASRDVRDGREKLAALTDRLAHAFPARMAMFNDRLDRLDRMRQTLGYTETLRRGYAVVRDGDALITTAKAAGKAATLEIEFHDGRVVVAPDAPKPRKTRKPTPPAQGDLF